MVAFALRKAEYLPVHAGDGREAADGDRRAGPGPDPAGLDAARHQRPGAGPALAPRRPDPRHPDHHAHRPRRGERPGQRPGIGHRRLRGQALLGARTAGAHQGGDAPLARATRTTARWRSARCASTAPRTASSPATQPLHVGPTEYRLLHFFMTHTDRVYTRAQLLDHVWGGNVYVEERTVDVHIRRLRKALEPAALEDMVQTVRGSGYRFSRAGLTRAHAALAAACGWPGDSRCCGCVLLYALALAIGWWSG